MKEKKETEPRVIRYNDLSVRIIASLIAAHIVTEYGGTAPWLPRLLTKEYYIEFGTTLLITFLLVEYIYRIVLFMDKRYPWGEHLLQRICLQFVLGVIIPSLGAFLMAALYFNFYGVNILKLNYHLYALPFITSLITLFNFYYLIRYLLIERAVLNAGYQKDNSVVTFSSNGHHPEKTDPGKEEFSKSTTIGNRSGEPQAEVPAGNTEATERKIFIVNTLHQSIPVRTEDICCFFRANGLYYCRTYSQTISQAYIIPQTLKEIEELIDPVMFFRINRRMIVRFTSCVSFRSGKGKNLELIIDPAHVDLEVGQQEQPFVTVSEDRVKEFRAWIDR